MPRRSLIGPHAKATPFDNRATPGREHSIPHDLLKQASRRLEILALIGAALWLLAPALGHLAGYTQNPEDTRWAEFRTTDLIAAVSIACSIGLYLYLRARDRNPALVMDLGLGYLVVMAFDLGVMMHWGPVSLRVEGVSPMITWIGPITLMVAAIFPVPPWKMFVAGLLAALMDPLGMVIAQSRGVYQFGALANAFLMHYPNFLLLGVAIVISHVVTRLGQQVARERELGSYRLGELLGRGGMGEVYRATHRMLARPAAIKLIRRTELSAGNGDASQLAIRRFHREAEAAAGLRSPHTVELYDFGETDDRTLYFVMELLDGMTLESLVRDNGPVQANRAIYILRQVCESLEEAHARGLVHRDIKPANIHVGRVGLRYDFVKVLDFGLVKSVTGTNDDDSLATAAGLTPGTPAYMAPETTRGDTVDRRSDIYALGCVAYYLLTGQLVFDADSALQMVARHLAATPVAPSQRVNIELPPGLEDLVLSCLAKEPSQRPQTAEELSRRLAAIEVTPWTEQDAEEWWRSRELTRTA